MLTRKQQWRRVRGPRSSVETHQLANRGGGKTCPRPAGVPDALAHPRAISIDDSLLRLVATGRPAASDKEDELAAAAAATAAAAAVAVAPAVPSSSVRPPKVDEIDAICVGSNVRFNHQVRVVLVPSRKELRPLIEELWWGTNDYIEFRREFVQAMREAAAAEVENKAKQETPSVSEIQDTAVAAAATASEATESTATASSPPASGARGSSSSSSSSSSGGGGGVADDLLPPLPRSPPSPLSSASLTTPLPPSRGAAGAAPPCAVKVSKIFPTAGGPAEGQEDGGGCDGGLLRPAAPGVVLVATSIPPEALTLASAAATVRKPPATAERRRKKSTAGGGRRGRKKEGTSLLPSPGSFSSSRDSWRLVAPAVQKLRRAERVKRAADFNWAPIAGPSTAAAKAAAAAAAEAAAAQDEEEDGGYRTHSLSSASEEGCDDSDEETGHGCGKDGECRGAAKTITKPPQSQAQQPGCSPDLFSRGCGKDEECRGAAKTMTKPPQQPGGGPDLFSRDERTVCMA